MNRRRALSASVISGGGSDNAEQNNYLTIVALQDGLTAKLSTNACEYCVDGDGNWKTLPADTNTETILTGHSLSFRGNLTPTSVNGIGTFTISRRCNLEGNCMSMLFGDEAADNTSLSGKNYAFYNLFRNCTEIASVSSGFLPATTLANSCYYYMFCGCTSLLTAPELPATTLATYCYESMFRGCISLAQVPSILPAAILTISCYNSMFYDCSNIVQAPELSATTLTRKCFYSMFHNCVSLTQAPELPAKILVDNCYSYMFYNCSKLNYIKAMFTTTPSTSYTSNWVQGVASTGKFIKNSKATWNVTGVHGIPSGWSIQSAAE